jgi:hypothetical protein
VWRKDCFAEAICRSASALAASAGASSSHSRHGIPALALSLSLSARTVPRRDGARATASGDAVLECSVCSTVCHERHDLCERRRRWCVSTRGASRQLCHQAFRPCLHERPRHLRSIRLVQNVPLMQPRSPGLVPAHRAGLN